jgi:hypothetical protein
MSDYNIFPAVDRDLNFNPGIRAALAKAQEFKDTYAHLEEGVLVIAGKQVGGSGGGGGTTGPSVSYSDATATDKGVSRLATANDVAVGTSGAVVIPAALLKTLLAGYAKTSGTAKGLWSGTQSELDAIPNRDANTLYFVVTAGS